MGNISETQYFQAVQDKKMEVSDVLEQVYIALTEKGYNLSLIHISTDRFHVIQGNIIDNQSVKDWAGYDKYDIVVANILADVIILLVNEIPAHLKQGGYFITSGIINMKEEAVKAAFAKCEELELVEVTYRCV